MRLTGFAFILAVLATHGALAQVSNDSRNFPAERLRLSLDREGLIDVESPTTPGHLKWEAGLWVGVSKNLIVLFDLNTGKRLGSLLQDRVSGSVWGSVGLASWLELGLEIPLSLYQWRPSSIFGATNGELQRLSAVTMGNLRLAAKAQFLRQDKHGVSMALETSLGVPSGAGTDYASDPSFTFGPELSVGRTFDRFRTALNVGLFLRPRTTFLDLVVHHELQGRLGAGYRFGGSNAATAPWELDASLSTVTRLARPFQDANNRSLEVRLMGARSLGTFAQVFVGGGMGLLSGWGTPDWRVFGGIRFFAPSSPVADALPVAPVAPKDRDLDGYDDDDDACPDAPDSRNSFDGDGCPLDTDPDHDGLVAEADECPSSAGLPKDKGCPDTDGDGIIDRADRCPTESEDLDRWEDDDGCPDPDNDGDGLADAKDGCANAAGPLENKGCPETDRDNDTVADRVDNCPDVKGAPQNQGCAGPQLVVVTANRLEILQNVFFKPGSDVIEQRSFRVLDNVVSVLEAHPEIDHLLIEGHTANQGSSALNMSLSKRRAAAVKTYLVKHGIDSPRLVSEGFGSTLPVENNATAEGRAKNRRVVFTVKHGSEP